MTDDTPCRKNLRSQFPDDATCLEWLRNYLYPDGIYCNKCEETTLHHRVKSRPSYSCDRCGHHVHPTAGDDLSQVSDSAYNLVLCHLPDGFDTLRHIRQTDSKEKRA